MKKKLFIIVTILITAFLTTACGDIKKPLTSEEFYKHMDIKIGKRDYNVVDLSASYKDHKTIKEMSVATNADETIRIEFYVLTSETAAQSLYIEKKQKIGYLGNPNSTEVNAGNFTKYASTTKEKHYIISKVASTLMYVEAKPDHKEKVNNTLKEIGY